MDSIRRLPCLQAQVRKQFGLSPASSCPLPFVFSQGQSRCHPRVIRAFSTKSAAAQDKSAPLASQKPPFAAEIKGPPPLSLMPLPVLLRSLMVTSFMTSPRLLDMAMPIMDKLSTTQSWFLSPDKNPALKGAVRFGFYDHFAGGADRKEVRSTIGNLRGMGYHGAILSFAKEIVAQHALESEEADADSTVAQWKEDNLQTLDMLGPDDVLALKFSGAGPSLVNSLRSGGDPSAHFKKALHEVCDASLAKGTRVFVDAEQQCFQDTVDKWTLDLMRKYNVPEKKTPNGCLVYTTLQAYLKKAPGRLLEFLRLAQGEGWTLGLKLVRGAYIASENRGAIWDTKRETDDTYNGIIRDVLLKKVQGISAENFPSVQIFVATHNEESVLKAMALERELAKAGKLTVGLDYAQLMGMADELGCRLVQETKIMRTKKGKSRHLAPKAFKLTVWGTPQECMQWLLRRAVENRAAVERAVEWRAGLTSELMRRLKGPFGGGR